MPRPTPLWFSFTKATLELQMSIVCLSVSLEPKPLIISNCAYQQSCQSIIVQQLCISTIVPINNCSNWQLCLSTTVPIDNCVYPQLFILTMCLSTTMPTNNCAYCPFGLFSQLVWGSEGINNINLSFSCKKKAWSVPPQLLTWRCKPHMSVQSCMET